jgi:hypothetical protein
MYRGAARRRTRAPRANGLPCLRAEVAEFACLTSRIARIGRKSVLDLADSRSM